MGIWLMMSIISCKVNGARIEVWEKIYDHWDLGNHGLTKECRIDPCGGCESVECISNNIQPIIGSSINLLDIREKNKISQLSFLVKKRGQTFQKLLQQNKAYFIFRD